jgi:hypothetical protein
MKDDKEQFWQGKLDARLTEVVQDGNRQKAMVEANVEMVRRAVAGLGPDTSDHVPELGARMVANMAAVHVPAFSKSSYKNRYDLGKGGDPKSVREIVDAALEKVTGAKKEHMYFGAVELQGSGIRFYGDICLVLKRQKIAPETTVLWSNSYDLVRPPITPDPTNIKEADLPQAAQGMAGRWGNDAAQMAALKTLAVRIVTERRLTMGQISEAVLEDEDYLEILKIGTFEAKDLQEARTSAADVAAEAGILERLRTGPCPTLAELHWRKHRRAAAVALRKQRIEVRAVTTSGRVR